MKKDIDQMKPPGFQAKEMIIEHVDNVHERPVVVRDERFPFETPDILGKYDRYVSDLPDPGIFHDL